MKSQDYQLSQIVAKVLTWGLTISVVLMVVGIVWVMAQGQVVNKTIPFPELPGALVRGDPAGLLSLGLVVLLATPAVRELVLLIGFARQRRWIFVGIAFLVLAVLLVSVLISLSSK
jgi:uncharacterized membrane protein